MEKYLKLQGSFLWNDAMFIKYPQEVTCSFKFIPCGHVNIYA